MYRYTSVWSSDGSIGRSDDEKRVSGDGGESDHEIGNLEDPCRKRPKTPRRFVTAGFINLSNVSSYSPDSDAIHGCGMSDCTPESADETDVGVGFGEAGHIDLRLRVRRFDEENALLREELVRTEELVSELERKTEHLRWKLDQTNERCHQLQRENEEYREILAEAEAKERDCRLVLQKVEKQRESLARNLECAEAEKHQISSLTSILEKCKKEKLDGIKQLTKCRQDLESKQSECEMLKEKLIQLEEVNETLTKSYEKTIRHLREKNDELRTQVFDLQVERSVDNPSDIICSTPPTSYLHSYMQSTPYNNRKDLQLQDSLYSELRASGFPVEETANESKIRDLQDEITWYNEEIRDAVTQIDHILESIDLHRRTPYVPVLKLEESTTVKTADIYELLQKLSRLSNKVNEIIWKPKVKDASSQICSTQDDERICRQYGIPSYEDSLRFAKEKLQSAKEVTEEAEKEQKNCDVFVEAFSMNSRLLGEYVEELEIAEELESQKEALSPEDKESMSAPLGVQERTIIDPIVEEIDRILQCTNKCEEESSSKNPRSRCIYTCAQPSADLISTDLTVNSPKPLENKFAATYVITSGGDSPSVGMVNHSNTNGENSQEQSELMVKINSTEDSNTFDATSLSMVQSSLEETKPLENETLAEVSICSKLRDTKFDFPNPDSFLASSTFAEPTINNLFSVGRAEPRNGTTYCVTPNVSNRKLPKRKISVYGRSFDVDTQQCGVEGGGSNTYRVMERSVSSPDDREQRKRVDAIMELDPKSTKQSSRTKDFRLHAYRTNNDNSDSSEPPSPEKPMGLRQENSSVGEISNRPRPIKIILAPTKLKLPLVQEIPAYTGAAKSTNKNSTVDVDKEKENIKDSDDAKNVVNSDTDITVNETQKTYDLSNVEVSNKDSATEVSSIDEMIRPGDEIERGVTYRRAFTRDSHFSAYSLLSPLEDSGGVDEKDREKVENVSTVVMSDGESTSCDSSPKREAPVAQSALKHPLVSTYAKPGNRNYARPDPSKTGGSRHVDRLSELCYQSRNDSTSGVGSYSSGGGNGGNRSSVEKASVVPAVALAMSSGEDTSDSECDPMAIRDDEERRNVVDETRSISPTVLPFADGAVLSSSTPAPIPIAKTEIADVRGDCGSWNPMAQKRDKKERVHLIRRSLSEGGCGKSDCSCYRCKPGKSPTETTEEETRPTAFPSLTDARLQESGIANLSSTDELGGNLTEADLERKCTAFSVGLVTDKMTLPRRTALAKRQRDQAEKNLSSEVQKMQQDIQDLAPLCIDRESVERVERVRHQLEMISQCAHRVSCTAETLGAVHQENRVSRAVLLADRYLLVLRSRCEKLASDLAETKRILTENNIVFEETNGELGDDMPRIRYRGMPTNNRTMMARRRASIATIFRPLGPFQDVTKDGVRQRNSVSGRVTLRRPSLSAESQKWEAEKLDRTDSSSSSIGELREIFEQAESRRASREENNNVLRLHSSNLNVRECENEDGDVWTNPREEPAAELPAIMDGCQETRVGRRTSLSFLSTNKNQVPWKLMFWCIIISFIFGFYMKHVVSSVNKCSGTPFKWWSLEELMERYVNGKNDAATPI